MRWVIIVAWVVSMAASSAWADGAFSRKSANVDRAYRGGAPVTVKSPDGASTATIRTLRPDTPRARTVVDVSGVIGQGRFDLVQGINGELLWSPDLQAFFVHASDGGGRDL